MSDSQSFDGESARMNVRHGSARGASAFAMKFSVSVTRTQRPPVLSPFSLPHPPTRVVALGYFAKRDESCAPESVCSTSPKYSAG